MSLEEAFSKDLIGIVSVTLGIGAGIIIPSVYMITHSWRKVRTLEQNAVLKKAMLDRGMSAHEIETVINAGNGDSVWENDNAVQAFHKMVKHGYSAEDIAKVFKDGPPAAKIKG
ncbi:MAG: hypothetical protein U0798_11030 [Gemmataceae bacterium]